MRSEDVVVPPKESNEKYFQMHSFVCECHRKALVCETDQFSDFKYSTDHRRLDPRLAESDISEDCFIACNLRVLQVKTLDNDLNQLKKSFGVVFPKQDNL